MTFLIVLVCAPLLLLAAACSRPAEHRLLSQFFRAARARDNTTLAMMSAVAFDPREQGVVDEFSITAMGDEQRTPLDFKTLLAAEEKARAEEAAFTKAKLEYQNANLKAIEEVLKLERDPKARWTPALQKVKAEWDKWREDTSVHAKAVSDARAALVSATGPAEASLTAPGEPRFDPAKFEGDLIVKNVTIQARVISPEGQTSDRSMTITLTRASGTRDGVQREGRWIITKIE
ncbi:MAG: hypothetical protein AB1635_00600 [Acidobacteriota bacterium]